MDKTGIKASCEKILVAANNIPVTGEKSMNNLLAICQLARLISAEIDRPDEPTVKEGVAKHGHE